MGPKVYLPEEVAEILRIPVDDVFKAVEKGQIPAINIVGHVRINEDDLLKVMETGHSLSPLGADSLRHELGASASSSTSPAARTSHDARTQETRDTNPEQVRRAKGWASAQLRRVAPDLWPDPPAKGFTANGKQGILSIATVASPIRAGYYWFGFPQRLLHSGRPTLIVPIVWPRHEAEPRAFVIPYEEHRSSIDRWAMGQHDQKHYNIQEERGHYYLIGKGMGRMELGKYLNAFHLFR